MYMQHVYSLMYLSIVHKKCPQNEQILNILTTKEYIYIYPSFWFTSSVVVVCRLSCS